VYGVCSKEQEVKHVCPSFQVYLNCRKLNRYSFYLSLRMEYFNAYFKIPFTDVKRNEASKCEVNYIRALMIVN
jgi:hypothetical protein